MGYVFLFICFLKVPVGAMPESFGGLIWGMLWEDPHFCIAYT